MNEYLLNIQIFILWANYTTRQQCALVDNSVKTRWKASYSVCILAASSEEELGVNWEGKSSQHKQTTAVSLRPGQGRSDQSIYQTKIRNIHIGHSDSALGFSHEATLNTKTHHGWFWCNIRGPTGWDCQHTGQSWCVPSPRPHCYTRSWKHYSVSKQFLIHMCADADKIWSLCCITTAMYILNSSHIAIKNITLHCSKLFYYLIPDLVFLTDLTQNFPHPYTLELLQKNSR